MTEDLSGLMDDSDWAEMEADNIAIRKDNEVSIALRREQEGVGNFTLPAQLVRVAGYSGGSLSKGGQTAEASGGVLVLGPKDLDIYVADRFTIDSGTYKGLYRVQTVYPLRRFATLADAVMVQ